MKRHHTVCSIVFVLCLVFILITNPINAQVIPTDEWITFYSRNTIFQGGPVPAGAVVEAYDPDSVLCGSFTVTTEGEYGFLFVYRDDTLTVEMDEGALPGDTITFKINGFPVKILGPDTSAWTENGDIFEIDLADNLSPTILDSITDIVLFEDAPDTIITNLDSIFFDPDNDSLIYSAQCSLPGILPIIDEQNRLIISLAPDSSGEAVVTVTAQDAWFTIHDMLFIKVVEINDPPIIVNLPDTSFSSDTTLTIDLNQYVEDVDHPRSSLSWTVWVEPAFDDSLLVEIDNVNKLATFATKYIFSADAVVSFTVIDDSLASDTDTIIVRVKLPASVEDNQIFHYPQTFFLSQNYPNPFNPATFIQYQLPEKGHVVLKIFNTIGQEARSLVNAKKEAGYYEIKWDGRDNFGNMLPSGIYLAHLQVGTFIATRKMALLK
jgi:hypothetical protein